MAALKLLYCFKLKKRGIFPRPYGTIKRETLLNAVKVGNLCQKNREKSPSEHDKS